MTGQRLGWLASLCVAVGLLAAPLLGQMATADRLQTPGWWPTKRTVDRDDFVGAAACVACHTTLSPQLTTAMARTAQRAGESPVLRGAARMTFAAGRYTYAIDRETGHSSYSVTDGDRTLAVPLTWALGAGTVGQTYIFERGGQLHEARASYYASLERLDFTPSRRVEDARDVEEAMARTMDEAEARRCFGCHTTGSSTASGFDLARAVPGITCEACHGPGRAHVAEMDRDVPPTRGTIMNPRGLDAVDSVDFCGACHATFWDVKLAGERGLAALRSQPHRLQSSSCWNEADDRITCVACHDPHKPLVRDVAAYDRNCLACHAPADRTSMRPCPTGTARCAGCHMPRYDVPEMHFAFTDHLIRVVR